VKRADRTARGVEAPSPYPGALFGECPQCLGDIYREEDRESPGLPKGKWRHVKDDCRTNWRTLAAATFLLIIGVALARDPKFYWQVLGFVALLLVPSLIYSAVVRVVILRTRNVLLDPADEVPVADPVDRDPRR
jgi:hypothetical protein